MSAEARYYYVDAQNQAAGPIAMAGLIALHAAGTVTDATLVVVEGGTEWVAFSSLKAEGSSKGGAGTLHTPVALRSLGEGVSSSSEPPWASQLSQKVDRLVATMEKLIVSLEKTRAATPTAPVLTPATAALHAEKINLNPVPKPGIATQGPASPVPRPSPQPTGLPISSPKPAPLPIASPRPSPSTPLTPLAVPANAQKSPLALPALGKTPAPTPAPAKGNIFSKFLKK